MNNKSLLVIGVVGTLVTALCCFTPVLLVLLSVLGLSAFAGTLDLVLLPMLASFVALTGFALWRRWRAS